MGTILRLSGNDVVSSMKQTSSMTLLDENSHEALQALASFFDDGKQSVGAISKNISDFVDNQTNKQASNNVLSVSSDEESRLRM